MIPKLFHTAVVVDGNPPALTQSQGLPNAVRFCGQNGKVQAGAAQLLIGPLEIDSAVVVYLGLGYWSGQGGDQQMK